MKELVKEVKLTKDGKKVVVGSVTIPIYETVDELAENVKSEDILEQFNKGNTISIMNAERNKHKPATAGKQKRTYVGLSLITTEEFQATGGDPDKIKTLIDSDDIQNRIDEFLESQE